MEHFVPSLGPPLHPDSPTSQSRSHSLEPLFDHEAQWSTPSRDHASPSDLGEHAAAYTCLELLGDLSLDPRAEPLQALHDQGRL